jgi:hypothetical protein
MWDKDKATTTTREDETRTREDDKGRVIFKGKMCTMVQYKNGRRPNNERTNTDEQTNKQTIK